MQDFPLLATATALTQQNAYAREPEINVEMDKAIGGKDEAGCKNLIGGVLAYSQLRQKVHTCCAHTCIPSHLPLPPSCACASQVPTC